MTFALRIEKHLPASREHVFDAFVDAQKLARWWGPHGYRSRVLELDARVDGGLRIEVQPPEGDPFHIRGEFQEVDRARAPGFTFSYEEPTPDDQETLVRVSLAGETTVVVTHGGFRTEERRALHEAGWAEVLERLEAFLK